MVVDPDTHPDLDGSALIGVAGSGSRRAKMTHKNRKKVKNFHVLKCWMFFFENLRLLL
jgi:hypothetical protein